MSSKNSVQAVFFLIIFGYSKLIETSHGGLLKERLSMLKEMHPKKFKDTRVFGVYVKPFPKPPSFLSASRSLCIHRQKKPFQVAYDGPSFYTGRFSDKKSPGKIVTRLLSYFSTVPSILTVWSDGCHVRGRRVDFLCMELVLGIGGAVFVS